MRDYPKLSKALNAYNALSVEMRATLWFIVCNCIQKGILLITIPIFTRIMSVEQYGVYGVYHTWSNLFSVFITLNFAGGVLNNGMLKFRGNKASFISSVQALTTVMTTGWLAVYVLFRMRINALLDLSTPMMLCMFAEILLNASFSLWAAWERYEYRYKALTLSTAFFAVVSVIIPPLCVLFLSGPENAAQSRIFGTLITEFISYGWVYLYVGLQGRTFASRTYWAYVLKFNVPLLPHYLAMMLLAQIDRVMIKTMTGEREAGIYTLAYSLAICLQVVTTAIGQGFTPWLYRKLNEDDFRGIPQLITIQLIVMAVMILLLAFLSPEIIALISTQEYWEASFVIAPVASSTFFIFVYQLLGNFEFYFYKNIFIAIASGVAAVLNIALNWVFIRLFGYLAAGYTTLFSYAALAFMHCAFVMVVLKEHYGTVKPFLDVKSIAWLSLLTILGSVVAISLYGCFSIRLLAVLATLAALFVKRKDIMERLGQKNERGNAL